MQVFNDITIFFSLTGTRLELPAEWCHVTLGFRRERLVGRARNFRWHSLEELRADIELQVGDFDDLYPTVSLLEKDDRSVLLEVALCQDVDPLRPRIKSLREQARERKRGRTLLMDVILKHERKPTHGGCLPTCACGWVGCVRSTQGEAMADWADHHAREIEKTFDRTPTTTVAGSPLSFNEGKKIYDQGWNDGLDKFASVLGELISSKLLEKLGKVRVR